MSSSRSGQTADQLAVIDRIFDELSQRARPETPPAEFLPLLLERAAYLMDCQGAAFWIVGPEATYLPLFEVNAQVFLKSAQAVLQQGEREQERPRHVTHAALSSETSQLALRLAIPGEPVSLFTFFIATDALASGRESLTHLARAVGEVYEEYVLGRRRHLDDERLRVDHQLDQLALMLHRSLDLDYIATETASSGRALLDVDRLAVARSRAGRTRVLACSGAATVQRRSAEVRALARLVRQVVRTGTPLMLLKEMTTEDRRIATPLQEYLRFQPETRFLCVIPLHAAQKKSTTRGKDQAVLVVQSQQPVESADVLNRVNHLCQHLAVAWEQARRFRMLPLARWQMAVAEHLTWTAPLKLLKWPLVIATLVAIGWWGWHRPARMTLRVEGELVPGQSQVVFAPANGVIEQLAASQHQEVELGAPLLTLRSSDLDQQRQALRGQILAALSRLDSLQVELNTESAANLRGETSDLEKIASQLKTTEQELENLQRELELLDSEAEKLAIVSPTQGTIVTWDLEQRLAQQRPVKTGDALLEIVDMKGEWNVRLFVPDHRSAGLLDFLERQDREPEITFVMRTDVKRRFVARLKRVDEATTVEEGLGPVVRCEATVEAEPLATFRPGATVIASIDLGPSCLGEVYTHEFIETLRRNLFW